MFPIPLPRFMKSVGCGLAVLALGWLMTVGAVDYGKRTANFNEQGVRTTAVVYDIRPEQPDPREPSESTSCILEFDGRQVERRLPGRHDIGEKFDITYQPDTSELCFTSQCPSPWKLWSVLSVIIFFGLTLTGLGGCGVIAGLGEMVE